jgi:hypothetical protein
MEEGKIKYTIVINQKAVIENKFNLDVIDMAIFDFICYFVNSKHCEKTMTPEGEYFWIAHTKIISELPIIKITTKAGIIKRIENLEREGLLERHPRCREIKRTFYRFGLKYDTLFVGHSKQTDIVNLNVEIEHPLNFGIEYDNTIRDDNTNNDNSFDAKTEFLKEFNRVKCSTQPTRVLGDKAVKQLNALLKAGYTITDIGQALENAMKTKNHKESNFVYLTPEFITRADKFNIYYAANFTNTASVGVTSDSDYD